ncbi:hypothetical protein PO909_016416 [Leuciscus waleckii]
MENTTDTFVTNLMVFLGLPVDDEYDIMEATPIERDFEMYMQTTTEIDFQPTTDIMDFQPITETNTPELVFWDSLEDDWSDADDEMDMQSSTERDFRNSTGSESKCEDIDECKDPDVCGTNAVCKNHPGSFVCECSLGYSNYGNNQSKCIEMDCDQFKPQPDAEHTPKKIKLP